MTHAAPDHSLRQHLDWLLAEGGAHVTFEAAVADIPDPMWAARSDHSPHTLWRLLEHLRICQEDILEFSRRPDHVSPEWPAGYWPAAEAPAEGESPRESLRRFRDDLSAMRNLIADPDRDLFAPFPWGDGQTLLREALLLADHNSYHLGQFVALRRALGIWEAA